jgi:hypothetical protein
MFLEILPALFHFHEHDGFPDIIGEGRAAAVLGGFADAEFGRAAHVKAAGLTKSLEKAIKEDLRLALFVAGDIFLTPGGKFREFFPARHGRVLPECRRFGKVESTHTFEAHLAWPESRGRQKKDRAMKPCFLNTNDKQSS